MDKASAYGKNGEAMSLALAVFARKCVLEK